MSKAISIAEFPIVLLAGILGQKAAAKLWRVTFGSEIPDTGRPDVRVTGLIAAGILEGVLYKFFRMLIDRGLRAAVLRSTGTWPGRAGEGE